VELSCLGEHQGKFTRVSDALRVLIAGGGTGGHVIPALAIARALRDHHGAEVRMVGTARGLETKLVPEAGFRLELVHVGQLKNVSLATRLRTAFDLPRGILRCISLLREFRPQVVIGVGGYASGPAMLAAFLLRIPMMAYEPNAAPGLANRLIGKHVDAAAVNFAQTQSFFRNAEVTGVPVREAFFSLPERVSDGSQHLLVFGGSMGARALNQAMPRVASALLNALPRLTILHQAGAKHLETTQAAYAASGADPSRWQVRAFLDDMPARFADADLILCRSGSSVAELAAAGKPSLLVPFPFAADDHQHKNALIFAQAEAAVLVPESELTDDRLTREVTALLDDPERLREMGARARTLAHPDALQRIANMAVRLSGRHIAG
jgi:UDP-N-acetylglucosamine--N-acetylmuramyl-(pentapeptide) pyrophosphoryl-undecaprenol N-acetylglucosamine transferase